MLIRKKHPFLFYCRSFFLCCWDSANINSSNKENQRRGSEWNLEGKFYVYVMWRKWNFVYMLRNILMPERRKKSRERKKKTHIRFEYIFISFAFIQYFNSGKKLRSLANKKFHHTTRASFVIVCSMWDWMILLFNKTNGFLQ